MPPPSPTSLETDLFNSSTDGGAAKQRTISLILILLSDIGNLKIKLFDKGKRIVFIIIIAIDGATT